MVARVPHEVSDISGTFTAVVNLPDVYATIGSLIGVTKIPANESNAPNRIPQSESLLKQKGLVFSATVRYKVGGSTKPSKIICSNGHVQDLYKLVGKAYKGGVILSVSIPRRAVYS